MVMKACDWCKKQSKAFLVFLKPRSWIRHRTRDKADMLFCSLACFKAFTGIQLRAVSAQTEIPVEDQEKQLLTALAK